MKSTTTLAAAFFCLSVVSGCSSMQADEKGLKPVKVKTVENHSSSGAVRYSASIRPASQVDVAFKVGGYIDSIAQYRDQSGQWRHIQAGDIVRKGTVLARVRQNDYVARVNEAKSQHGEARSALEANNSQFKESTAAVDTYRAQVNDAQASFERARLDFDRAKVLYSTHSITKPDYDSSKAQYEIAQAKLDAARGQLKSAEARVLSSKAQINAAMSRIKTAEAATVSATIPLEDTQLKAPITAVVLDRKVEVGSLVSQGVTGFVLADLSSVKAAFGVPDLALASLKLGNTLAVTSDALPGGEFSGHISRISPSADQTSRAFDVEVTIPNVEGRLRPGMIVALSLNESVSLPVSVPAVPLTAITRAKDDPNAYAVFVVEERDGKKFARLRKVTLGESMGNAVVVTSGVNAGEVVVTTGVSQVSDGEQISIIP